MNVPWDAVGVTAVVMAIAAGPLIALCERACGRARQWRAERRAVRVRMVAAEVETARFMKGLDLDLALEQLLVEYGALADEPADDLMLLADEVFKDGEP